MPAMSSASVAVTRPSRSRTCRYARAECLRKSAVAIDEQRQDRHRREREPPVEEEEDDRGAEQGQRVLHEARDAVRDELVERLDVVRQPADDHAGAVALVVAEREALQVAEQLVAKVGEDALAGPAREVRLRRRRRRSSPSPASDEERDDRQQRLPSRRCGCRCRSRAPRGTAARARTRSRAAGRRSRARCAPCTARPGARASRSRRAVARHDQSSTSAPRARIRWLPGLVDSHAVASTREANSCSSSPCS